MFLTFIETAHSALVVDDASLFFLSLHFIVQSSIMSGEVDRN